MSTSTVSLTPHPSTSSRRRPLDKKSTPDVDPILSTPAPNTSLSDADVATNLRFSIPDRDQTAILKQPVETTAVNRRAVKKAVKPPKPKWLTVTRVLIKNLVLLLVVTGLVQIVRKLWDTKAVVTTSDGITVISADLEGKFSEMENFVKRTSKMFQVQVDVIDRKLEKHAGSVKEELERRDVRVDEKLREVRDSLEKEYGGRLETLLSKEEFEKFVEGGRGAKNDGVNLDDVRVYAKEIVEKEIEKHAADGLGRVDYALGTGGGRILKHSEAYVRRVGGGLGSMLGRSSVHLDAEKMLIPSFGEPGKCFAMKGSSGFVVIKLRTAVVPEAITLEHVAKSVAYDRSSAPKDCRVSGWHAQAEDSTDLTDENEKMFLLSEFTYDLEKSNAQTFEVSDSVGSSIVDTIRFDFTSNHGSSSHTCVYRLRVHGHEPSPSLLAAVEP